jgi:UDP-galactopyranose mutase
MLDHPNITVHLNSMFERQHATDYQHTFYSGPIDAWFDNSEGRLGYRTLDFISQRVTGDFQGNAVINYGEEKVAWTRISEHKHFAPWEDHDKTIVFKEFSRCCDEEDIPYYPIRLVKEKSLLNLYTEKAAQEKNLTFIGRLGTYRYLDMHVTIAEALNVVEHFIALQKP